jgi:hypothetical protein
MIIRFLLKEDANANKIHRKLQAQVTIDVHSLRKGVFTRAVTVRFRSKRVLPHESAISKSITGLYR